MERWGITIFQYSIIPTKRSIKMIKDEEMKIWKIGTMEGWEIATFHYSNIPTNRSIEMI